MEIPPFFVKNKTQQILKTKKKLLKLILFLW